MSLPKPIIVFGCSVHSDPAEGTFKVDATSVTGDVHQLVYPLQYLPHFISELQQLQSATDAVIAKSRENDS